jgi:ribonucleoside-diphosphate reductase alpha chain
LKTILIFIKLAKMPRFNINHSLSENAKFIVEKRYLKVDSQGRPLETPKELFVRVAKFIAQAENDPTTRKKIIKKTEEQIKLSKMLFSKFRQTWISVLGMSLLDRGKEELVAACYVLPIHDSVESIYGTLANTTTLHRRGAGIVLSGPKSGRKAHKSNRPAERQAVPSHLCASTTFHQKQL